MNEQQNIEPEQNVEGNRVPAGTSETPEDTEGHRFRHDHLLPEDEDTEGHRFRHDHLLPEDEDTEGHRFRHDHLLPEDEDTEGHRFRHDHLLPEDEDVEGHGSGAGQVQPPRDADLGGTEH